MPIRLKVKIVFLYCLFAGISTAANISSQVLFTKIYSGNYVVEIAIVIGTFIGLPIKYMLDKNFIFLYSSKGFMHEQKLFALYSFIGLLTTAIFWGFEYFFYIFSSIEYMRYIGAIVGLSIGYYLKFQLDKRFVFSCVVLQSRNL